MPVTHKKGVLDLIGQTPLVKLNGLVPEGLHVYTKWEWLNPTLSMKDRIALYMIEDAEKRGLLEKGMTIVAPSSGNTATSIAMVATVKGYKVVITVPDRTSLDKISYTKAFGAEVVLCRSSCHHDDSDHYIKKAAMIAYSRPRTYLLDQYNDLSNQHAHYYITGPEIWEQTDGTITHLVVPAGSGGAICGVAKFLKCKNPTIKVISPDVKGSVYGFYKKYGFVSKMDGNTEIEGAGKKNIPVNMDIDLIDEFVPVSDEQAFSMCEVLAKQEGILVGGSSGAAFCAAQVVMKTMQSSDIMVVVFPDSGIKYLSKTANLINSN